MGTSTKPLSAGSVIATSVPPLLRTSTTLAASIFVKSDITTTTQRLSTLELTSKPVVFAIIKANDCASSPYAATVSACFCEPAYAGDGYMTTADNIKETTRTATNTIDVFLI